MRREINLCDPACELTAHIDLDGVWLTFKSSRGRTATINVEALASNYNSGVSVIGAALYEWVMDRKQDTRP